MERNMKIGIFDSGVGGLIIGRAIRTALPQYDYLYYGDTEHMPYGEKTQSEIFEYTKTGVGHLFDNGCTIVIIACNSASSQALRKIQQEWLPEKYPNRKVLGVIVPTVEDIAKENRVGIIATRATVDSKVFSIEIQKRHPEIFVIEIPAPELASLIEIGNTTEAVMTAEKYLKELVDQNIDTLVLGCTHYPLIKKEIADILKNKFGKDIAVISQDEIIPKKLADYFTRHPEIESKLSLGRTFTIHLTKNSDYIDELVREWLTHK